MNITAEIPLLPFVVYCSIWGFLVSGSKIANEGGIEDEKQTGNDVHWAAAVTFVPHWCHGVTLEILHPGVLRITLSKSSGFSIRACVGCVQWCSIAGGHTKLSGERVQSFSFIKMSCFRKCLRLTLVKLCDCFLWVLIFNAFLWSSLT